VLVALADTHAVIWYIFADKRLSSNARTLIDTAAEEGNQVGLSVITLAEIVYLIEKERIPLQTFTRLISELDAQDAVLTEIPFDRHVAETLYQISRLAVPDLPDRIIAATALHLSVPVISRDAKIQVSGIETIW
jgi:PIN domain nuclease of toxin-antitoxin system